MNHEPDWGSSETVGLCPADCSQSHGGFVTAIINRSTLYQLAFGLIAIVVRTHLVKRTVTFLSDLSQRPTLATIALLAGEVLDELANSHGGTDVEDLALEVL